MANSNFGKELKRILDDYGVEVSEEVNTCIKQVGDDCAKDVRKKATALFGGGKYARSWKNKYETTGRLTSKSTIHATNGQYRLAHLLEHGHAKWLWGKNTGGTVSGRAHIRPAEDAAIKKLERQIEERLGR